MKPHPGLEPWFIGTWIVLGIAGFCFTYLDKNVERKKRSIPVFAVGAGAIFAGFVALMTADIGVIIFVVPFVALITWLNIRMIAVCSNCGRTIQSGIWFAKAEFCPKCGAPLK